MNIWLVLGLILAVLALIWFVVIIVFAGMMERDEW